MNTATGPEALPEQAVELLTRFNRLGMTGPTMTPDQASVALTGLISLLRATPNALRHIGAHLLTTQRHGLLADSEGSDSDELVERIRQRVSDTLALIEEVALLLDQVLVLTQRCRPLTCAQTPNNSLPVPRNGGRRPEAIGTPDDEYGSMVLMCLECCWTHTGFSGEPQDGSCPNRCPSGTVLG
ncbi:hypothetical protein ACFC26_36510 [Kitasatospora purpeofusca]|uniref:hypothetical protein n=1 Tax=Kitasatospora purpeofusca TaxID=67352 RepID=UPI0035DCAD77